MRGVSAGKVESESVTGQVIGQVGQLLASIEGEMSRAELQAALGLDFSGFAVSPARGSVGARKVAT